MVGVLALIVLALLVAGGIGLANFLGSTGTSDAGTPPAAPASTDASSATPTSTDASSATPTSTDASSATPTSTDASSATPTSTAPAAQAPLPAAAPSGVCNEAGIKVSAAVDKAQYAAGVDPKLTLRVTNTGKAPCNINVGTSQMEFKVTSGEDIVFNSRDCQADSTNLVKGLQPGASETASFTWKRNRSAAGCAKVTATPGPGTYVFMATLGKWSSGKTVFALQ